MKIKQKSLLENLNSKVIPNVKVRRYNLSDMISESYKALYDCNGDNLHKIVESHLSDVRSNPTDIDRLSRQLCTIKELIRMTESEEIKDEDLDSVVKSKIEGEIKESKDDEDVEEIKDEDVIDESVHDEDVEETDDEDLLEDDELTDAEIDALTQYLGEMRKAKKMKESSCDSDAGTTKKSKVEESDNTVDTVKKEYAAGYQKGKHCWVVSAKGMIVIYDDKGNIVDQFPSKEAAIDVGYNLLEESKSYKGLKSFKKQSESKAFYKTFKRLDSKLHEGTALTRQESISLYKAANSAMTHLSVELEHNPEFLDTFKESVSLLSVDVNKLLNSLKEGKAPSKATMKSLAKFSEALLYEDEEEEELPPIEDEEEEVVDIEDTTESEEFDQEYADARVELHKELEDEHADSEDPEVQEKLEQDAEDVTSLPGITDDQIAEITGEDGTAESDEGDNSDEEVDSVEESCSDCDITDDELEELKKHLTEMRRAAKK